MINGVDFMSWSIGIGILVTIVFIILASSYSDDDWQCDVGCWGALITMCIMILNTLVYSIVFDLNAVSTVSETPIQLNKLLL